MEVHRMFHLPLVSTLNRDTIEEKMYMLVSSCKKTYPSSITSIRITARDDDYSFEFDAEKLQEEISPFQKFNEICITIYPQNSCGVYCSLTIEKNENTELYISGNSKVVIDNIASVIRDKWDSPNDSSQESLRVQIDSPVSVVTYKSDKDISSEESADKQDKRHDYLRLFFEIVGAIVAAILGAFFSKFF